MIFEDIRQDSSFDSDLRDGTDVKSDDSSSSDEVNANSDVEHMSRSSRHKSHIRGPIGVNFKTMGPKRPGLKDLRPAPCSARSPCPLFAVVVCAISSYSHSSVYVALYDVS